MFKNLFITILFGVVIGLSTAVYILGLERIQIFHHTHSLYPALLIFVFGAIALVKRKTLYFPTGIHEIVEARETEQKYWSPWGYAWNLVGSWMSHLAGASLGREGTVLVLSGGLVRICKLNWTYFKPIIISAAFGCVIGQPWIALVFVMELFVTNIEQKILSIVMAWIGVLILQTLQFTSLFQNLTVDMSASFSNKLFVAVLTGLILGCVAHFYKKVHVYAELYLKKHYFISVLCVLALMGILFIPSMKPMHSLSLDSFVKIQSGHAEAWFILVKILLTLACVSLGFIGGDFIPMVIIGSGTGVLVAQYFHVDYTFGFAMGLLAFFTGVTRLKWTGLWTLFLITGFGPMAWGYLCLSVARYFSGQISLYRKYVVEL